MFGSEKWICPVRHNHPANPALVANEPIPLPYASGNQYLWPEHKIDEYLCACLRSPPPPPPAEIKLIGSKEVTRKLHISRRTLSRKILQALAAAEQAAEADA